MRFIHRENGDKIKHSRNFLSNFPSYGILSHTWGPDTDEVSYDDLVRNVQKVGYKKLELCERWAERDGLRYFWVDTCCIDKSNSAELAESITSMFSWYQNSAQCYTYLSDVMQFAETEEWKKSFRNSRWFKRGWTLQELLAPRIVKFYSEDGEYIGDKVSLEGLIHEATGIPVRALRGCPLSDFSVEERFSWTSQRKTTRPEDGAYCLQGIFGVSITPNYGEALYGDGKSAFRRLKKAIDECNDFQDEPRKRRKLDTTAQQTLSSTEQKELLQLLEFDAIDDRYINIKPSLAKTCTWMLHTQEYLDWLDDGKIDDHHSFLWVKGNPGCGKSTLAKFMLIHLKKQYPQNIFLSFFFNARGDDLEKSIQGLFRSLLLQIFRTDKHLLERIPSYVVNTRLQTNTEKLKELLSEAMKLTKRKMIVVVDALDECADHEIRDMVEFFERLGQDEDMRGKLHVLFVSRMYPQITMHKSCELRLDRQDGHSQDIDKYLVSELRVDDSEQAQILHLEIAARASGIFMWVVLVVQMLNQAHDDGEGHALLEKLKHMPSDLHELFRDILTRDQKNVKRVQICVQWLLCAKRSLKREELYLAILSVTDPGALGNYNVSRPSEKTMDLLILSSSKGLAEVTTTKNSSVQFIHESVRDFLLKEDGLRHISWNDQPLTMGHINDKLRECCQTYIQHDAINSLLNQGIPDAKSPAGLALRHNTQTRFPFLSYAINFVLAHTEEAHAQGIDQKPFLTQFDLNRWAELHNILQQHTVRRYETLPDLLYILVCENYFGLVKLSARTDKPIITQKGGRYNSPVGGAIVLRRFEILEFLIEVESRALSPGFKRDFRDFQAAKVLVEHAPSEILQKFLSVYKFKLDAQEVEALLTKAALRGSFDLVQIFLSAEYPSPRRSCMADVLRNASSRGYAAIVRILLEAGADVNFDAGIGTALQQASANGHEEVVCQLIKAGASLDFDSGGGSALTQASANGHTSIVKQLLQAGELTGRWLRKSTPLLRASSNGHQAVVSLLTTAGALLDPYVGATALAYAAEHGHASVVNNLINAGVSPDAIASTLPGSALQIACSHYRIEVVKTLIKAGADVNLMPKVLPKTPLEIAFSGRRQQIDIVVQLLTNGAHVGLIPAHVTRYAIEVAISNNDVEMIDVLRTHGLMK